MVDLWGLVERGEDEQVMVLAFFHVLEQSKAGNAIGRRVRRQILKAYKTHKPNESVRDAVTCAFDGWQNRNAMEGSRP